MIKTFEVAPIDVQKDIDYIYNIIIQKTDQGMVAKKIARARPSKKLANIANASLEELEKIE